MHIPKKYDIILCGDKMRFRKLKNLDTRRDNCSDLRIPYSIPDFDLRKIDNVHEYIDFSEHFVNDAPLVLEIGCGKGQFATQYAKRNPDKNIVGIECVPGVLVIACEKAKKEKLEHAKSRIEDTDVVKLRNLVKTFMENHPEFCDDFLS